MWGAKKKDKIAYQICMASFQCGKKLLSFQKRLKNNKPVLQKIK